MTPKKYGLTLIAALTVVLALAACHKQVAKVAPPTPAPALAPSATLAANPDVVQQGQPTTLTWHTENANDVSITGIGKVAASGSHSETPGTSTTYTLVATGPGGTQEATARVTVNTVAATSQINEETLSAKSIKDVYFDFDKYNLRPDGVTAATHDAKLLEEHPETKILIEGHCDDRGSEEYNLALGANRANQLKESMEEQGVNASRIKTISYGKEKPFCNQEDEQCWQENRRDHIDLQ